MNHINLIGDSIIDNINYVPAPGKSVLGHLDDMMPEFSFAQLATDGFTTEDVARQLSETNLQSGVSVLSVGGNDLLKFFDILTDQTPIPSPLLLDTLLDIADQFSAQYIRVLEQIKQPLMLCTIYNPAFYKEDRYKDLQKPAETAVGIFNDRIYRAANEYKRPVLELRDIFTHADDYANPIEPSDKGGKKLADEIAIWGWNAGVIYND